MRCLAHRKDQFASCMWCGGRLCEMCIAKRDGSKVYCEKCAIRLAGVRRARLPPVQLQQKTVEEQPKKKLVITKDGYVLLGGQNGR